MYSYGLTFGNFKKCIEGQCVIYASIKHKGYEETIIRVNPNDKYTIDDYTIKTVEHIDDYPDIPGLLYITFYKKNEKGSTTIM